ncbi:TFIIH complex serine/threonine-protein kinase subunit kin28, partial [Gonapodya sp. JEL0774]
MYSVPCFMVNKDTVRELRALRELHHPNIIQLYDVFSEKRSLCFVLEYLPTDLEQLIRSKVIFHSQDIKSWMLMLLRGLYHLHRCHIIHRDLKPGNLLLSPHGELKIADFGLARELGEPLVDPAKRPMTPEVVTLWYRAPELLMGAREYGTAIDIWAVGCIFAELFIRHPFIASETYSSLGQLTRIFTVLGAPKQHEWPGVTSLPGFSAIGRIPSPMPLREIFKSASSEALDLLSKMLLYDPLKRISAKEALEHPFFLTEPRPTPPAMLPKLPGSQADTPGKKRKASDD